MNPWTARLIGLTALSLGACATGSEWKGYSGERQVMLALADKALECGYYNVTLNAHMGMTDVHVEPPGGEEAEHCLGEWIRGRSDVSRVFTTR